MMNPRQLLIVPMLAVCAVALATAIVGLPGAMPDDGEAVAATPPADLAAPLFAIAPQTAAPSQPDAITAGDQDKPAAPARSKADGASGLPPAERAAGTPVAPPMPTAVAEAAPLAAPDARSAEPEAMQVANANPSDVEPVEAARATPPIEIVDECLVVDICVDRYLWALYQRTPKEDAIKVQEWRDVVVKRKRKMVTVSRAFTRLVDQDFGWKDPDAAVHAGRPMMDYVIGGMERSFKLKLFQLLHAAEAAGLSPGITSGFRDDYRQSIASGLKAANNRSYHGGSLRGGYGHGLAADVVSVDGATRDQRFASSSRFWTWIDAHGQEFGIGRPYLGRDPPHVAPIDGEEYAKHHPAIRTVALAVKKEEPAKAKVKKVDADARKADIRKADIRKADVRKADVRTAEIKRAGAKKGKRLSARDHARSAKPPRTAAVSKPKAS
ncbi:peptidase M15 [Bradyrhizobium sp. 2TAF24]|uniref:peptidase M15 n=1 Tax=Bradyrhizobium sp. 2TAF24 TaxID=3233011 RepID=UPI003F9143E4